MSPKGPFVHAPSGEAGPECWCFRRIMEEIGTEREDAWGPIAMTNWRETPCIQGRAATEDDANAGRAVFYLNLSEGQESRPVDLDLPRSPFCMKKVKATFPSSSSKRRRVTTAPAQSNSLPVIALLPVAAESACCTSWTFFRNPIIASASPAHYPQLVPNNHGRLSANPNDMNCNAA